MVDSSKACFHCGEPVPAGVDLTAEIAGRARPMCCRGCQAVASLIHGAGLERYYEFRDALPGRPDEAPADPGRFAAWDRGAVLDHHGKRQGDRLSLVLVLENVHCPACAWLVQRFLDRFEGVEEARLDVSDGRLRLEFDPARTPLSRIAAGLARLGYPPHLDTPGAAADRDRNERRAMLRYIAVAGIGMMQVMSYALAKYIGAWQDIDPETRQFFVMVSMLVAVPVALYAGQPFYRSAWRHLVNRRLGLDVPVAAAMLLALGSSVMIAFLDAGDVYFDSVVMFIFFLLLGRYAVMVARQKSGALSSALARALPAQALRRSASGSEAVGLVELMPGDRVLVAAGETVPADGEVVDGRARVDEALLSGESVPRPRAAGDRVLAGSLVRDGHLEVEVTGTGQSTVLAGIVGLLADARSRRPRLAVAADRLAGWFIGLILAGTAAAGLVWLQLDPSRVIPVVLSMLVVSCPCALALGTPTALAAATRAMARSGILIARPDALELLPRVSRVVLDKTGTLTRPEMDLAEVRTTPGLSRERALALAGRLERTSSHPVASAFRAHDDGGPVEDAGAERGSGVGGEIEGIEYRLGRPEWACENLAKVPEVPGEGIWVTLAAAGRPVAWFRLDSALRSGAAELIDGLHARGIEVWLASGDRRANVARVAGELGIEHYRAEMQPADKLELVRRLQAEGATVAMVGDGINDAPVLAGADVSLALAEGAAIARTQSDLVVTGRGLERLIEVFALAPRVRRVVRQNLGWALAYNLTALPLAATGLIPPWLAAIGMSASSLLVVLNAQRLGHSRKRAGYSHIAPEGAPTGGKADRSPVGAALAAIGTNSRAGASPPLTAQSRKRTWTA